MGPTPPDPLAVLFSNALDARTVQSCDIAPVCWLRIGAASARGWRLRQEDAHDVALGSPQAAQSFEAFCAVFDGHAGAGVAQFCARQLRATFHATVAYRQRGDVAEGLREAFLELDRALADGERLRARECGDRMDAGLAAASAVDPSDGAQARAARRAGRRRRKSALSALAAALALGATAANRLRLRSERLGSAAAALLGACALAATIVAISRRASHAAYSLRRPSSPPAAALAVPAAGAPAAEPPPPSALVRDAASLDASECGATALAAVVQRADDGTVSVTVANAGACRCVLSRFAADGSGHSSVELSTEHRPTLAAEKRRILLADSAFSRVDARGRIGGVLACSRALGSLSYKRKPGLCQAEQVISPLPDVRVASGLSKGDMLLLATDGVWDCLSTERALSEARRERERLGSAAPTSAVCAALIGTCLADSVRGGRGSDNMTVILAEFE